MNRIRGITHQGNGGAKVTATIHRAKGSAVIYSTAERVEKAMQMEEPMHADCMPVPMRLEV